MLGISYREIAISADTNAMAAQKHMPIAIGYA